MNKCIVSEFFEFVRQQLAGTERLDRKPVKTKTDELCKNETDSQTNLPGEGVFGRNQTVQFNLSVKSAQSDLEKYLRR